MKVQISTNKIFYGLLYLAIGLLCVVYTYSVDIGTSGYFAVALATTVEIVVFLIIHKKVSGEFISFASIFMLVLALFHFGQVWMCGYWEDLVSKLRLRVVLKYFADTDCISAMRIINISFLFIGFGLLQSIYSNKNSEFKQEKIDLSYYQSFAKRIILITFPIKIIVDLAFLYISFTSGFSAATIWNGRFPDFIKIIGNFSMIGFGLLICSLEKNKAKQLRVYLFIISYLVLLMISGKRSETVAYIVMLTFLYLKTSTRKKLKLGTVVLGCILGYLLLTFLYTTVRFRGTEGRTVNGFFDLYIDLLLERNIFMESIREYGNTGYTPVCVIENWLKNFAPSYGKSYYLGLFLVFPNVGGLIGTLNVESAYALQLQRHNMVLTGFHNIGGSVIGELFFNFGIVGGIIASLFLGLLLGSVSNKTSKMLKSRDISSLIYTIPVMYASLYWIRDTFGNGIREVVWGIIFCYIIRRTLKNRNETKYGAPQDASKSSI